MMKSSQVRTEIHLKYIVMTDKLRSSTMLGDARCSYAGLPTLVASLFQFGH